MMDIREARETDLPSLLDLYTHLHDNAAPPIDAKLETLWGDILADANHHILVGIADGRIVCSCVLVIVPNLTHGQRPYALIENVVTHAAYRKRGYAGRLLDRAREMAVGRRCYKIMLMTGSKEESTLRFYEAAGYNRTDKTAFVQWLE